MTRSVTHLTGAERPTAGQLRGMNVFERSDDHVKGGAKAESHAKREDSACLNYSLSFGALDKRSTPERSDEARSEVGARLRGRSERSRRVRRPYLNFRLFGTI